MTTNTLPLSDVMNSCTGFEEIAVEAKFGNSLYALFGSNLIKAMRAAVFILHKRAGKNDRDAYQAAMSMPVSDLDEFFPDEVDEPMPEEPTTEAGKDDSASE